MECNEDYEMSDYKEFKFGEAYFSSIDFKGWKSN